MLYAFSFDSIYFFHSCLQTYWFLLTLTLRALDTLTGGAEASSPRLMNPTDSALLAADVNRADGGDLGIRERFSDRV